MVADRIRLAREALGMNQTEFADELGVSRSFLSNIENGRGKISIDFVFHVSDKFSKRTKHAGIHTLLTGDNQPVPWGATPEASPLNHVLALDTRALEAAQASLASIEASEGKALSRESKARYVRGALYIYMSEFIRAKDAGVPVADARAIAEQACDAVAGNFDLPPLSGD